MKVIVIGTGFGEYAAAPVYRKLGFGVEVVSPRDQGKVNSLLASKADLVSVHSPPFMHHEHVMKAIDHGHNVLCDKPFGLNAAQAREMRDHANKNSVLHFLNFEARFKPWRIKFRELVEQGAIGKPRHFNITFFSNGFRGGTHGWINEREMGGGWIFSMGSHLIDYSRLVLNSEVARCGGIVRIEDPVRRDRDGMERTATAEDAYSAWFVMENGCTVTHDTAYAASVPLPARYTLMGSDGALEMVGETKLILRRAQDLTGLSAAERIRLGLLASEGDEVFEFHPAPGEAHEPQLIPWFGMVKEALETGRQIKPSFDDGVAVATVMDQLKENSVSI